MSFETSWEREATRRNLEHIPVLFAQVPAQGRGGSRNSPGEHRLQRWRIPRSVAHRLVQGHHRQRERCVFDISGGVGVSRRWERSKDVGRHLDIPEKTGVARKNCTILYYPGPKCPCHLPLLCVRRYQNGPTLTVLPRATAGRQARRAALRRGRASSRSAISKFHRSPDIRRARGRTR